MLLRPVKQGENAQQKQTKLQSAVDGLFYSGVDNYSPVPSNPVASSVDSSKKAMDISP